MAKAPAAPKTTSIVKWDEELAKMAEASKKMEESVASGQLFSFKGGVMTFNDAPMPDNQVPVIILDSVLENVYYEGKYDSDNPSPPTCFAFGRDDKTIKPHISVIEVGQSMAGASGLCAGCEMNEWASADTGRGKACRNTRRLAVVPAGHFTKEGKFTWFDDPDECLEKASIGFMKLPVTSVKGYAAFVKQIASALKRPPLGVVTKVKVVPDPKNQFKVVFEPVISVPDKLMHVIMQRAQEAQGTIEQPYSLEMEEKAPPKRGAKKQAATRRGKY